MDFLMINLEKTKHLCKSSDMIEHINANNTKPQTKKMLDVAFGFALPAVALMFASKWIH